MTTSAAQTVLADLSQVRPWVEDLYRDLHEHPELSHQEQRTAGAVASRLDASGYDLTTGIGVTGVVGVLHNGGGPTVLLRADMDALPVKEATGLPYASTAVTTESGGEVAVMHACGHDVHVACLLGAATLLAAHRDTWSGTLVALFQPGEELGDGARRMVEDSRLHGRPHRRRPCAARPAWHRRDGGNPLRAGVGGRGQHAHHGARTRRPRVDAPGVR